MASTPGDKTSEKKGEEMKKEDIEGEARKNKEKTEAAKPAAGKKRAVKKLKAQKSEEGEESSEDEFDPEDTSPTPSKRRGAKSLTFAESALATAIRTPPATRASRKSAQTYRAPSSSSESVNPQSSSPPQQLSNLEPTDLLYQFGVKGYDEPLLGRREPVMSSPVALLPRNMDQSATPRATADEHYQKIQEKTMEKLQAKRTENLAMVQEQAMNNSTAQRVSLEYSDVLLGVHTDTARRRMKMTGTQTRFARTSSLRRPSTTTLRWMKTTTGHCSTRWRALR
jgi:hypothetical protein